MQVLLDLRFAADVLSGGDLSGTEQTSKTPKPKIPFRRKQDVHQIKSVIGEHVHGLINQFSQRLDPIDWLTLAFLTVFFFFLFVLFSFLQRTPINLFCYEDLLICAFFTLAPILDVKVRLTALFS